MREMTFDDGSPACAGIDPLLIVTDEPGRGSPACVGIDQREAENYLPRIRLPRLRGD